MLSFLFGLLIFWSIAGLLTLTTIVVFDFNLEDVTNTFDRRFALVVLALLTYPAFVQLVILETLLDTLKALHSTTSIRPKLKEILVGALNDITVGAWEDVKETWHGR